jgi:molybdate transport system regulatory protein
MEPKFKIWLEQDGEVLAGNGKIGLLKRIGDTGSIQKAADQMGMSYRHAWGFIQKAEKRSGIKFLETQVGGRDGGGARLTPQGKDFLERYSKFREGLDDYIEAKFKKAFKK